MKYTVFEHPPTNLSIEYSNTELTLSVENFHTFRVRALCCSSPLRRSSSIRGNIFFCVNCKAQVGTMVRGLTTIHSESYVEADEHQSARILEFISQWCTVPSEDLTLEFVEVE